MFKSPAKEDISMTIKQIKKEFFIKIVAFVSLFVVLGCATTENERIVPQPVTPKEDVLRIGLTPTAPPLIFYQDGRILGLEAEFAGALAKSQGKIAQFVVIGWSDLISALLENRVDIIMSGMSITKTREASINFTSPYLKAGQMALVRSEDLSDYPSAASVKKTQGRVGFVQGTTGDFLVQREFQFTSRKVPFPWPKKGVQALAAERIDMLIHDAPIIWWLAAQKDAEGLAPLSFLLNEEYLAWAIRKNDDKLLKSANQFLETWKNNGRLNRAIKRWMPYATEESLLGTSHSEELAHADEGETEEIQIINKAILIKDKGVLEPSTVTTNKGTTVIWINTSSFPIEIVFIGDKVKDTCGTTANFIIGEDGSYKRADLPSGGTASLCFKERGVYKYKMESSMYLLLEYGEKQERTENRGTIVIQ